MKAWRVTNCGGMLKGLEYMCGFLPTPSDSDASSGPYVVDLGDGLC